jgi:hypothetical protein
MKQYTMRTLALGALAAVALVSNSAKANVVWGNIDFSGTAGITGTIAAQNVTTVTPNNPMDVQSSTEMGDYTGIANLTPVTFSTLTVAHVASESSPLWTFDVGGVTYAFTATSENYAYTTFGTPSLTIGGTGWASITGDTSAFGDWSVQITGTGSTFSFQSNANVQQVPDSGTTALLISLGLLGVGFGVIAQHRNPIGA